MHAWEREDELVLIAKVNKEGILGKISKVLALDEQMRKELWELQKMIEVKEEALPDEEQSQ